MISCRGAMHYALLTCIAFPDGRNELLPYSPSCKNSTRTLSDESEKLLSANPLDLYKQAIYHYIQVPHQNCSQS